jgi:hypothetical protein
MLDLIIQANVNRSSAITTQLLNYADKRKANIIMIQEPYTFKDQITGSGSEFTVYYSNKVDKSTTNNQSTLTTNTNYLSSPNRPKSAILIRSNLTGFLCDEQLSNVNSTVVVFDNFVLISMYFNAKYQDQSNRSVSEDCEQLKKVFAKYNQYKIIICCDSNSHHSVWGGDCVDERGEDLLEFMFENDLKCINDLNQGPTFIKICKDKIRSSFIDLTLVNNKMNNHDLRWSVVDNAMNTEHRAIEISISTKTKNKNPFIRQKIDYNKTNWNLFFDIYNQHKPHKI